MCSMPISVICAVALAAAGFAASAVPVRAQGGGIAADPATALRAAAEAIDPLAQAAEAETAWEAYLRAQEAAGGPVAEEFVLTDLQDARAALEEVTGTRTSEDLLRHIFSRFCIGK